MRIRLAFLACLFTTAMSLPVLAQDHAEVGAFANYFRLSDVNHHNFAGLGGRLSVASSPHVQWEGEMAYDFEQVFNEAFTNPQTNTITFQRSPIRILHGVFGPKFHTGTDPWRAFVTLKTGFINFRFDNRAATFGTFTSSIEDLRSENTRPVLYPGGGVVAYLGPLGFRLEIGDEIFFLDGAHHNLRVTVGPSIRF